MNLLLSSDLPSSDVNGTFHRLVSENNLVEMGVHRVMYGFRVRAGFVDDYAGCTLDWCAGGDWEDVQRLYSICRAILLKRPENEKCFNGMPPHSNVKPFYNDFDFVARVAALAGDFELIKLQPPILNADQFRELMYGTRFG